MLLPAASVTRTLTDCCKGWPTAGIQWSAPDEALIVMPAGGVGRLKTSGTPGAPVAATVNE